MGSENTNRQTILMVVGEDQGNSPDLIEFLEVEGYDVIAASNIPEAVAEALDFTQGKLPDLILMDLNLEAIDELSAIRSLRQESQLADVPLVTVSRRSAANRYRSLLAENCDQLLTQPVSQAQLKESLDHLLNAH